jgi:hypothetical protein
LSWNLNGVYVENCSCTAICPCSWTGFTAPATYDRCKGVLSFHVNSGAIDGVDVSGLNFGIVIDTPQDMTLGGWRVGVIMDGAASPEQAEKMGACLTGTLGGVPASVGKLIGELMGIETVPISYKEGDGTYHFKFGDIAEVLVKEYRAPANALATAASYVGDKPVVLHNLSHPLTDTLTVAPPEVSKCTAFGVTYKGEGSSGYVGPFSWSG